VTKFFLASKRFWLAIAPFVVRVGIRALVKYEFLSNDDVASSIDSVLTAMQIAGLYYIAKGGDQLSVKVQPQPDPPTKKDGN
jgi:hypothetical protein